MSKTIAITGKGGTGKTTISALMIRYLRERKEGPILAIDADPDSNLGSLLGITVPDTIGDLREDLMKNLEKLPSGMSKQDYFAAGLNQIIIEHDQFDFLAMGRSEGPGCYCMINNLLRKFAVDLTPSYKWVVMDNEAGMEHLSRRTSADVEALIAVVNENPLTLECARRINTLSKNIPNSVKRRYYLINGVGEDRIDAARKRAESLEMQYLGYIPYDKELNEMSFKGESVLNLGESPAVQAIKKIMDQIRGEE